ncbi:MAG: hypothetical protein K0R57_1296 [Paenibacillaceae bacterium]|nr:hypothetical protein [Paenibacillaceae bacterium]
MKRMKKATAMLFAACLLLSAATACGKSEKETQPSAAPAAGGEASAVPSGGAKKEISISIFDRGTVVAEEGTYENNRWTRWINENAPAAVKWVPVPRNEAQTKLNTLIASGSAPDLIWEYDRNYITQLVNQGAVQPIDQYIEKYSTYYKKYLSEHPELKPYLMMDGKMYAVSNVRGMESIANNGMWIRQDWLDKLGLKTPATVEEFIEVARQFKNGDPDGNGKADTIPIAMNQNGIPVLRALFFTHENQWYLEDGQLKFGRTMDRYADYMTFQKQLFDEGLIDKEYITDKNNQRSLQFWTTGKAGILLGNVNMENEFMDLKKNVPQAKMRALESVSTKYGKNGLYQETPPNMLIAFNSSMKEDKIEAAVKFLDWMIEKGWKPLRFGEENVHYKLINNEIPQIIDPEKSRKEVGYALEYGILHQYALKPEWLPVMAASSELSQEYAKERETSLNLAIKNKYRRDIAYSPSLPEVSQLIATFAPIAAQIETKAIVGGSALTPQAALEDLRKEWKRLGGENVEKLVNEWYQKNKDQL